MSEDCFDAKAELRVAALRYSNLPESDEAERALYYAAFMLASITLLGMTARKDEK